MIFVYSISLNFRYFSGAEGNEELSISWMKSTVKQVTQDLNLVRLNSDTDSSDSEIEMVAVVTSDKRKFKTIKIEDEADVKIRVHSGFVIDTTRNEKGEQIWISDRICQMYEIRLQEITGKKPLIAPSFMKGRIENPKYKDLKRTIPEDEEENEENLMVNGKKPKMSDNVQVEVMDLPSDWINEGVAKMSSIADAYGESGEKATEKVFLKGKDCFVVVFKRAVFAERMYESLNHRPIDDCIVRVTKPHPVDSN